jgi:hypothetical protein
MTKKDYVLLAGALNRAYKASMEGERPIEGAGVLLAALELAAALKAERPEFDRGRFLDAVRKGVTP